MGYVPPRPRRVGTKPIQDVGTDADAPGQSQRRRRWFRRRPRTVNEQGQAEL